VHSKTPRRNIAFSLRGTMSRRSCTAETHADTHKDLHVQRPS